MELIFAATLLGQSGRLIVACVSFGVMLLLSRICVVGVCSGMDLLHVRRVYLPLEEWRTRILVQSISQVMAGVYPINAGSGHDKQMEGLLGKVREVLLGRR